jgi:hypothetical protein
MTDEIRPALTAEEWKGPPNFVGGPPSGIPEVRWPLGGDRVRRAVYWDEVRPEVFYGELDTKTGIGGADNIQRPHALAALCLYGQPFGFTHEDVAALWDLHGMALNAIDERGDLEDASVPPRAAAAIAKIEALLPPK